MKNKILATVVLGMAISISAIAYSDIWFDDGEMHIISDDTYQNDTIFLDSYSEPGTQLVLISPGSVGEIQSWGYSASTIFGGYVQLLFTLDNSSANIYGGTVQEIRAWWDSTINIAGGSIGFVDSYSSTVTILGGTIGGLQTYSNGIIFLDGEGFQTTDSSGNIINLAYGDKLSNFGTYSETGAGPTYSGSITGTLKDGSTLNTSFSIIKDDVHSPPPYTGDIIIIPEPCTLMLLGIGALAIGAKRKTK